MLFDEFRLRECIAIFEVNEVEVVLSTRRLALFVMMPPTHWRRRRLRYNPPMSARTGLGLFIGPPVSMGCR
jgi:hypothetical protein